MRFNELRFQFLDTENIAPQSRSVQNMHHFQALIHAYHGGKRDRWLVGRKRTGIMYVCMYGHTYSKSMDQPGNVASPARGQLNRKNKYCPVPRSCLRIWSRETGSAVPSRISLLISILRLNLALTYGIPPEFRGGVHL